MFKNIKVLSSAVLMFFLIQSFSFGGLIVSAAATPFDYSVFSNTNITFNDSNNKNISGSVHANSSFTANGGTTITGNLDASSYTINGTNSINKTTFASVSMGSLPAATLSQLPQTYTYNSDKNFDSNTTSINGEVYVHGNVIFDAANVTGTGTLRATGSITFNHGLNYSSNGDDICIYSESGDIILDGPTSNITGTLYAPKGKVVINTGVSTVQGKIIANEVMINGTLTQTAAPTGTGIGSYIPFDDNNFTFLTNGNADGYPYGGDTKNYTAFMIPYYSSSANKATGASAWYNYALPSAFTIQFQYYTNDDDGSLNSSNMWDSGDGISFMLNKNYNASTLPLTGYDVGTNKDGTGYSVCFNTYPTLYNGSYQRVIYIKDGYGNVKASVTNNNTYTCGNWTDVKIQVKTNGIDVYFNGSTSPVLSWSGTTLNTTYNRIGFGAATGNANSDERIRYVQLTGLSPATPTGLTADAAVGGANISWNPSAFATGYYLYRSTSATGTYTKVSSSPLASTSYSDTGLSPTQTYYYKVSAVNPAWESSLSGYISVTPLASLTPPTNVTVTAVGGFVVPNALNATNTDMTAQATIAAKQAAGGKAELYIGTTLIATDSTIASGDTTIGFDLGKTTTAQLQAAVTAGGVVSVKLYDQAGNSITSSSGNPTLIVDYSTPNAPTGVSITPVGGTVVANSLNGTNTNMTAQATITAGQAGGGKAELYIGSTLIATDSTIASGDTTLGFDLGKQTAAQLQAAVTAGGVVSVKLYDAAGNSITSSSGNPTLVVDYSTPNAPTGVSITPVGGTVVANTLNGTNYNMTAQATITPGQATGGKAELYVGASLIATDSTIVSGDTTVIFDLGKTTAAALQAAVPTGGVVSVKLYDIAGNSVVSSGNPTLTVNYAKPAAPTGLTATAGINKVDLSWTAPSGPVTSYSIYRSTSASGPFTTAIKTGNLTTTYSDTDSALVVGTTYYYVVSALNVSGEGVQSSSANAAPLPAKPAAPTSLRATAGINKVDLSWTAPSGPVTSYSIYRSTNASGPFSTAIKTGNLTTTYSDTDSALVVGTTYYYVVSAVNVSGEGVQSSSANAAPLPVTVTGVTVNPTTLTLVVNATSTLTATVAPSNAGNKNVTWKSSDQTIATVDANGVVTAKGAGSATITVKSQDGNYTASCSVTVNPLKPAAPTGLRATAGIDKVDLSWTAPSGPVSTYSIYRSTSSTGPFITAIKTGNLTTTYSDNDSALLVGTTYYYVVSALNVSGEGVQSSSASAAPLTAILAAPTISENPSSLTNGNITVTITYPSNAAVKQYSYDGSNWSPYTAALAIINNCTVYARYFDVSNNSSETSNMSISNIDKTPPSAPTNVVTYPAGGNNLTANTLNGTNTNMTAQASITPDQANGGRAELYIGNTLIATDSTIVPGEATVNFDLKKTTAAQLQEAITVGGVVSVKLYDQAGNSASSSVGNPTLVVDYSAPTLTAVTISSSNSAANMAKIGDKVTLSIKANEALNAAPTVTIAGHAVTATSTGDNCYTAVYTMVTADTEGTVTFTIDFTDAIGNAGVRVSSITLGSNVTFDKTAPTISLVGSPTTITNNVTVTATIAAVGTGNSISKTKWASGSKDAVYFAGAGNPLSNNTFNVTANGYYTVYAKDAAGNETVQSINIDNICATPPTIGLIASTTAAANNVTITTTIAAVGAGNSIVTTKWEYGSQAAAYFANSGNPLNNITFNVNVNGTYTVYAKDAAGNENTNTILIGNICKTAPTIDLLESTTGAANNVTVTAVIAAIGTGNSVSITKWESDSKDTAYFASSGNTLSNNTFKVTANGTYTVYAKDSAGNEAVNTIEVSNICTTAPTISLVSSPTAVTNGNVTITAAATAAGTGNSISITKWALGTQTATYFASAGTTFSGSFQVGGNGTYTVYTMDAAGNEAIETIEISNIDKIPPTAPTNVVVTPVGGMVVDNTLNVTNTDMEAHASIVAGEAAGGRAELYVDSKLIATDSSIAAGDTTVSFDLNTTTPASLQQAVQTGGVVSVKLYDLAGNCSVSLVNPTLTVDYLVLAAPTNLRASVGDSKIVLSWDPSVSQGTAYYIVKKSSSPNGPFTKYNVSTASYTDTSVVNGQTYYYMVCASNQTGTAFSPDTSVLQVNAVYGLGAVELPFGNLSFNLESGLSGSIGGGGAGAGSVNTTFTVGQYVPFALTLNVSTSSTSYALTGTTLTINNKLISSKGDTSDFTFLFNTKDTSMIKVSINGTAMNAADFTAAFDDSTGDLTIQTKNNDLLHNGDTLKITCISKVQAGTTALNLGIQKYLDSEMHTNAFKLNFGIKTKLNGADEDCGSHSVDLTVKGTRVGQ